MSEPNVLGTLCEEFFSREKMYALGIRNGIQNRIDWLFNPNQLVYKNNCGEFDCVFHKCTVEDLLRRTSWRDLSHYLYIGKRTIEAINLMLRKEKLPEFTRPTRRRSAKK